MHTAYLENNQMSVQIILDKEKFDWCVDHATAIVEYYDKRRGGNAYNHNRVESNIVGVKGEVAVVRWLKEHAPDLEIEENFIQFDNYSLRGDLLVNGHHQLGKLLKKSLGKSFACLFF